MLDTIIHNADFCVIGGGLAGVSAAIAAARKGVKTVLMHERPVLGGNASSEVRMWICGAKGSNNRETGIIEEICLESLYKNTEKIPYLFDCVLLEKVTAEPNITLLLNCSCMDAETDGNNIISATGWQSTSQTFHKVNAKLFADCSGDSILAPLTGAEYRYGREAASEFNEKNVSIEIADKKTMGNSCLIQARWDDHPSEFIAPEWAEKFTAEEIKNRMPDLYNPHENFWYLEYGGEMDCIKDAEKIRDKLLAMALGMWDYIKNYSDIKDKEYWTLDFIGFLPGKRESRRMVGKYIMTSNDILAEGRFDDTVAYGGWPLDDHDPRGFYFSGKSHPSIPTPAPYGIPYRCLYSKNINNLFFAGRNISMTHAAMSSTRVMATCALLGEAVGTAASIAARENIMPDDVYNKNLHELQQTLMFNDCFLPHFARDISNAAKNASLSSDVPVQGNIENLRNGIDRNNRIYNNIEQGVTVQAESKIIYELKQPEYIRYARITFDSDLNRSTLPGYGVEQRRITRSNIRPDSSSTHLPTTLVKEFELSACDENNNTVTILHEDKNRKRTVIIPINRTVKSLTLTPVNKWYDSSPEIHIFSFDFG